MKKILCFITLFVFGTISAQNEIDNYIQEIVQETKNQYTSDPKSLTINKLFNEFYENILASDTGEISEDFVLKIQSIAENPDTKNMHILTLLFMFQEYINAVEENNEVANAEFQLKLVEAMEKEFKTLNQEIPILLYIYKIESLQNNEMFDEADALTEVAFKKFPNAVAIKAFQYLSTSDENLKNDLIKNHSNHWLIKQLEL